MKAADATEYVPVRSAIHKINIERHTTYDW
jgi:hypothetical protein